MSSRVLGKFERKAEADMFEDSSLNFLEMGPTSGCKDLPWLDLLTWNWVRHLEIHWLVLGYLKQGKVLNITFISMSWTSTEQIMAKWYYRLFQISNSSGTTETWKNPFRFCTTKWLNTSITTKLKNASRDWKSHVWSFFRKDKMHKIENRVENSPKSLKLIKNWVNDGVF